MDIIKSSGEREPFDEQKVLQSMLRAGARQTIAQEVLRHVKERLHAGMTTKQIYALVFADLERRQFAAAERYDLRAALLRLGPAGYKFEKYVASILNAYGYDAVVPDQEIEGSCVAHEVDVLAQKDHRTVFIEAKFRNRFSDFVDLKDTMATWARFLDLVDGAVVGKCQHFDEAWIVTNARFSDSARKFGICKGIHMVGWNFPKERPFSQMVDYSALYPITTLQGLTSSELEAFTQKDIMLCKEVIEQDPDDLALRLDIPHDRMVRLVDQCKAVVERDTEPAMFDKNSTLLYDTAT